MIIIFWHIRTMRIPTQKLKFVSFPLKRSPETKKSLDPLMEECKVVIVEKYAFQDLAVIIDTIFGIFDRSRIGSKQKTYA